MIHWHSNKHNYLVQDMIRRTKDHSQTRPKRFNSEKASDELLKHLKTSFDDNMPVAYLTAISKKYARQQCLHEDDKFVQQFIEQQGYVNINKLVEYLKTSPTYRKGQGISDDSVKSIYNNFTNKQGQLTYEYLMRMGEEVGVTVTDKQAKEMVLRFSHHKPFLTMEDCLKLNDRIRKKVSSPPKGVQKSKPQKGDK